MEWLIGISALLGTWSFLSVLGSERERRARDLDTQLAAQAAEAAKAAAAAPAATPNSHPAH